MRNGKISNLSQIAYIRRYTLSDGAESGLKIVEVNNGRLRFLLNESKALDMSQLWHGGTNISFVSKNGLTAREIPFAHRFEGGMLYTRGLDSLGARNGYELHGSLHNTPAKVVRAECTATDLVVEAEIRCSTLFGQNLLLRRTVTTKVGSDGVNICDTLTNEGTRDENYCLLYHVNLGYPMLDEGCVISAEAAPCVSRTPWAEKKKDEMSKISAPADGEEETCYFLSLSKPKASLYNHELKKTFTLTYSGETLPHFIEWKSMASGDYALGFEPATTELDERFCYSVIRPQESVRFNVRFELKDAD